jgi:succinate dehydrogenase / fumarate reductase flavoprotein subunit
MAMDALQRKESCGGHFREEYQDSEGETLRDDENFAFVGAWEYMGYDISKEVLNKEELKYEFIKIAARNYK